MRSFDWWYPVFGLAVDWARGHWIAGRLSGQYSRALTELSLKSVGDECGSEEGREDGGCGCFCMAAGGDGVEFPKAEAPRAVHQPLNLEPEPLLPDEDFCARGRVSSAAFEAIFD